MAMDTVTRRSFLVGAAAALGAGVLSSCSPAVVEKVVKETVIVERGVEKVVKETVIVERGVEKVVKETVIVEPGEEPIGAKPAELKGKVLVQIPQRLDVSEWIVKNLDEFHGMHPTLEVEIEAIPGWISAYSVKILAKAAADLLGDVCWYPGRHGSHLRWACIKMVRSLNEFADADGYNWDQFFEGALLANRWDGKQWWMSHISEPVEPLLAINATLAEERGAGVIDPEWNWDEFIENWATKVALEEGGRPVYFGYRRGSGDAFGSGNILRSYGAELIDEEGKKCLFDANDGLEQFLQFRHDVIHRWKVSPSPAVGEYNSQEEFVAGRLGATGIWPAHVQIFPELVGGKFEVEFVEKFKGPTGERGTMLNEHTLGMFYKSRNPWGAWEFLKWSCGEDMCVRRVLEGMGGPGGQKLSWTHPDILSRFPAYQVVADIMSRVEPDWRCANFRGEEVGSPFAQYHAAVEADEMTPKEAVAKITEGVNIALRLPIA